MSDHLAVVHQYFLPKQALTTAAGWLASAQAGGLTTWAIKRFVKRYRVNMDEAANPDIASYATFNDFFTRALRSDARPMAHADLICPVDGTISQLGAIAGAQIFQAKGHHYTTTELLGGDAALAGAFTNGHFATVYLSPSDYHRIHMPCKGRLTRMVYVPGDLFSVNPTTARGVPQLFARNERVVCMFDTAWGSCAMVLVGATIVGSIATVWHGTVTPPRHNQASTWDYQGQRIDLAQGAELGRFMLGSTIVLLMPPCGLQFRPDWQAQTPVRLGERFADIATD
jgi:phosphatidylserine decarboxylase